MKAEDSKFSGSLPDEERIERAAGEWLARRDGGLTRSQERRFEKWLRTDPRCGEVFAEIERAWTVMNRLSETAAGKLGVFPNHRSGFHWRRRKVWLAVAAGLAAAGVALLAIRQRTHSTSGVQAYATTIGEIRVIRLPDSSVVRLNTDSAIEIAFTNNERRVHLARGEAEFGVAKNPACPFIVSAAGVIVRAVGTAFDVRVQTKEVDVLVTEGKVRVSDEVEGKNQVAEHRILLPVLSARQRMVISVEAQLPQPGSPINLTREDVARNLAWEEHRLIFVASPLSEIVAEFNRYNRLRLVIADLSLAARQFGGTFRADDPETFVALLQRHFNVSVAHQGGLLVLHAH